MAHIDKCMFSQRVTNAAHDDIANIAGKFQASSADAICSAGFLCTKSSLLNTEAYGNDVKNGNTWVMIEAESTDLANAPIYACNPYNVQEATVGGNEYRVGHTTLGLDLPAGVLGAFTKIDFLSGDKIYRFGEGNLDGAISTNTFFTIDDGMLHPGAAAPTDAGVPYFELVGSGTTVEGTYTGIKYYDVIAKAVLVAAGE